MVLLALLSLTNELQAVKSEMAIAIISMLYFIAVPLYIANTFRGINVFHHYFCKILN